jgi:hypothetical protein
MGVGRRQGDEWSDPPQKRGEGPVSRTGVSEGNAHRIIVAVLQNIENWRERVLEAEAAAIPGNKARLLALARDIEQAHISLRRLSGIDPDP